MMYYTMDDCFAYDPKAKRCRALKELCCTREVCPFYKTREQLIREHMELEEKLRRD
jgi:hypothetical protein